MNDYNQDKCSICLEPYDNRIIVRLSCLHIVHDTCLSAHVRSINNYNRLHPNETRIVSCPVCRTIINFEDEDLKEDEDGLRGNSNSGSEEEDNDEWNDNHHHLVHYIPSLLLQSYITLTKEYEQQNKNLKKQINDMEKLSECVFCGIRIRKGRLRNHIKRCLKYTGLK